MANVSWQQVFHPATEFHWAGWMATLHVLTKMGWEFKLETDNIEYAYVVYGRHRSLDLSLMSHQIYADDIRHSHMYNASIPRRLVVNVRFMNSKIMVVQPPSIMNVHMGIIHNTDTMDVDTATFFDDGPEEIITEPETVAELMDRIREMQSPRAKELIQKEGMRERIAETQVSAKILTLRG